MEQEKSKQQASHVPNADDIINAIQEIWKVGNAS